jgi:hypothetical protein
VQRADGEYRWMLHHKLAMRGDSGEIIKWHGSRACYELCTKLGSLLRWFVCPAWKHGWSEDSGRVSERCDG